MWLKELKRNVQTLEQLKQYTQFSKEEEKKLKHLIELHPMNITQYYLSLIDWEDPFDPIKRMVVPNQEELRLFGSYDTGGERMSTKMPGLQHKYSRTALILTTNRCASYCRYCFRKRMVGLPTNEIIKRFSDAVKYIQKHKEINNILITGGDPFILPVLILEKFLKKLSIIPHIDFIRFGTKVPVVFPNRILKDRGLLNLLRKYSREQKRLYVVTQFNHPKEITKKSRDAINELINCSIIINNQTVLLKGVNDNPEILSELLNGLVGIGVNPYYVFQCRPVKRVKYRFQISLYRGIKILEEANKNLNGHSKRFKYIMSHETGKIEILGIIDNEIYFKYHEARNPSNVGKMFKRKLSREAGWLNELHKG